jgi:phenylacetate-CoA ligase
VIASDTHPMQQAAIAFDVWGATQASADALAQRRAVRLAALFEAAARTRLYAPLLAGRDPAQVRLEEMPPMRKPALMAAFDDWVADPALRLDGLRHFLADHTRLGQPYLDRYVVWESSGSSGEPGIFVQDAAAMAVYDALEALRRRPLRPLARLLDPWCLAERMAFVGATDGHFASTVSVQRLIRLNPMLGPRLQALSFLQPLPDLVAQLNALAPSIIATYPTQAVLLAAERQAGRLRANPGEVWTGGETLTEKMRGQIESAFGCPVADSYGLSEFLALASECRCGTLHLNSDWAILEPIDAEGRPVPPGVASASALLTNLANHVQPVIRCDIGDRITVLPERCTCGSALPAIRVLGRCDDTLHIGLEPARAVGFTPLALTTVLEDDAGLFDFQLVQHGCARLQLCSSAAGADAEGRLRRGRDALQQLLARHGVAGVHIDCQAGCAPRRGRSGKIQRVLRLAG